MTSAGRVPKVPFPHKKPSKLQQCASLPEARASSFPEVPTCVFSPFEDGGDLVALGAVTLGPDGRCAHPHRALVGLDPAQEGRGRASAVGHLCVGVVCLHTRENAAHLKRKPGCCFGSPRKSFQMNQSFSGYFGVQEPTISHLKYFAVTT